MLVLIRIVDAMDKLISASPRQSKWKVFEISLNAQIEKLDSGSDESLSASDDHN